jgi:hypothetical protein
LHNIGIPISSRGPPTIETGNAIELNSWLSPNSNSARLACFAQLTGRSTQALNTLNIDIPQFKTIGEDSDTKEEVVYQEHEDYFYFKEPSLAKVIENLDASSCTENSLSLNNISAIDSSLHDTQGITQRKD